MIASLVIGVMDDRRKAKRRLAEKTDDWQKERRKLQVLAKTLGFHIDLHKRDLSTNKAVEENYTHLRALAEAGMSEIFSSGEAVDKVYEQFVTCSERERQLSIARWREETGNHEI